MSYEANTINFLKIIVSDIFSNRPFSWIQILHFLLLYLRLYKIKTPISAHLTYIILFFPHFFVASNTKGQMSATRKKNHSYLVAKKTKLLIPFVVFLQILLIFMCYTNNRSRIWRGKEGKGSESMFLVNLKKIQSNKGKNNDKAYD